MQLTTTQIDEFKQNVVGKSYRDAISFEPGTPAAAGKESVFYFHDAAAAKKAQAWFHNLFIPASLIEDPQSGQILTVKENRVFETLAKAGVVEVLTPYIQHRFRRYESVTHPYQDLLAIECGKIDTMGDDLQIPLAQDIALAQRYGVLKSGDMQARGSTLYISGAALMQNLVDLNVAYADEAIKQGVSHRAALATHALASTPGNVISGASSVDALIAQINAQLAAGGAKMRS